MIESSGDLPIITENFVHDRDEITIKRLLKRCEEMSKQKTDGEENEVGWRLEQYIKTLDTMIEELDGKPYRPTEDVMASYRKRLSFLKCMFNIQQVGNPLEKARAFQVTPKPSPSCNKEVEYSANELVNSEIREELFGKNDSVLRRRTGTNVVKTNDTTDLDELLKYHHNMQEKIADNMLVLARNIKEQSLIAGSILRNDTVNVEKSAQLAEKNIDNLQTQSEKLRENTRRTSQCWIWILIVIVLVVFINMVLLMKMLKKKY